MASFITIAGVDYPTLQQGAAESGRRYAGSLRAAYDDTLINMTRVAKKEWIIPLAPMTRAQWTTLDAATSLRQAVTVSGEFNENVAITAHVTVQGNPFVPDGNSTFRRAPSVIVQER